MWGVRTLSVVLTLVLVFSTMGWIAHDHGLGAERGNYDCVLDHHDEHAQAAPGPQAEMQQSGKLHRHQCLGCHFSSHRPLFTSYREIEAEIAVRGERILRPSGVPRVLTAHPAYTLRGPPAC